LVSQKREPKLKVLAVKKKLKSSPERKKYTYLPSCKRKPGGKTPTLSKKNRNPEIEGR